VNAVETGAGGEAPPSRAPQTPPPPTERSRKAQVLLNKRVLEDMDTPVELAGVVINRVEPAQMLSFAAAVR
jgi:hypothetical protein